MTSVEAVDLASTVLALRHGADEEVIDDSEILIGGDAGRCWALRLASVENMVFVIATFAAPGRSAVTDFFRMGY
jgi:hypothetical protein